MFYFIYAAVLILDHDAFHGWWRQIHKICGSAIKAKFSVNGKPIDYLVSKLGHGVDHFHEFV